jgi:membrane fusion protein (multidrug efflux system)
MKTTKFLLIILAFSLFGTACSSKKESKKENGKYNATTPLLLDTLFTKEYVSEIQSVQNIEIRAKVKGFIESINVDEGQHVKAGQILFTIRPREYEAELIKARAEVKKAEVDAQNAKTLSDKNIISKSELALALAKLEQAKAEESLAALYVSYTKVTAPFDGIIDRLKFKQGSLIDEGTLLTTLSNNKNMYAYFNVSESEYLDFKSKNNKDKNNNVSLLLANGQPHKYKGKVETIEGEFDKNTGSIAFRAIFPNPDGLLKHGETGRVQMNVDLKQALIIPQKATFELQDKVYVYVVDKNNVIKSRNIKIKQRLNNVFVIESGLSENDVFILEGIQSLKDDDKVETILVPARASVSIK